jgi:hypothetical protein
MYLSIDVGIKNLAYILYDTDIVDWKVIELCEKGQNASKMNMIDVGKKLFDLLESITVKIDIIIIENQIGQNAIRMKMLQGMITFYFITKGIHQIHYWNAGNKLKRYLPSKTKTTYTQRKKYGIQITRDILKETFPLQISYFETHKKKDDLADCFLQLLDFLNKQKELPEKIELICNAINLK